ncbi:MAG: plasmid pRiA4b ORF-3 family protein [Acidobacteriota bacterium]
MIDLRIELRDLTPAVWRLLRVTPDLRLDDLHQAIQIVLGWQDRHLYVFEVGPHEYGPRPDLADEEDEDADEDGPWAGEARDLTVAEALARAGGALDYCYDFGDDWRVAITALVDDSSSDARASAPGDATAGGRAVSVSCLAGERAGPPEDIGGPHAYQAIVDRWAASQPPPPGDARPRHFDPGVLDLALVNRRLKAAFRQKATPECPAGPDAPAEQQLLAQLSLAVLWLGSRQTRQDFREASKTFRFEILETLQEAGLIYTDSKWKTVRLTEAGMAHAQALVARFAPSPAPRLDSPD